MAHEAQDEVQDNADQRHTVYPGDLERVNAFLKRFADNVGAALLPLDETGFTEVPYGDLTIGVNLSSDPGLIYLVALLGELPQPAPPQLLTTLLSMNFVSTGVCAFAIDDTHRKLYLRAMAPVGVLSFAEFEGMLKTLATVADNTLPSLQPWLRL